MGILTEKISGPAVSPGGEGMVTGQIDTCIKHGTHERQKEDRLKIGQSGITREPKNATDEWKRRKLSVVHR